MVSAGSACSSGKAKASRTILAEMGQGDLAELRHARLGRLGHHRGRLVTLRRGLAGIRCTPATSRTPQGNRRLMAAVKQTVEHVASLEKYQHGFVTDMEQDFAPKGLNADIVRFISAKKNEPELDAGVAPRRLRALAGDGRAGMGQGPLPAHRLPGQLLLRRAQAPRRAQRASTRSIRTSWRPTRSWASRCANRKCWRASRARRATPWTRCSTACQRGHHVQEGTGPGRRDLLLDERGDPRAPRAGPAVSGLGRAGQRTTTSPA